MSESTQQTRPAGDAPSTPKTSALALTSLILAVIPCCPPVNLLAVMLGVTALRRITRSGGALGGTRMAKAAIVVGLSLSVLLSGAWLAFTISFQQRIDQHMTAGVEGFIREAASEPLKAKKWWASDQKHPLDDAAIESFGKQVASRYGQLDHISFASTANAGSLLAPRINVACVFTFESSKRTGSAGFQLTPSGSSVWPTVQLTQIRIDDAERGHLTLGANAETP